MNIYKYKVPFLGKAVVLMPVGAKILTVARQGNWIMTWVLVDINAMLEERTMGVFATGEAIPDDVAYIGTVHMNDGLVWHVFEYSR